MASKKTVKSKGLDQRLEAKAVLKLSRRARAEIATLLKRNQAGTITRGELETLLEEVKEQLKVMIFYMHKFL
jgi:hypothetical protein